MSDEPAPLPPQPRTAPAALWAVAESFLDILYNLFGPPERIAFQHTLTKAPHQLLLAWLRAGEALMRRLLIIEAAAFPKPNGPPASSRQKKDAGKVPALRKRKLIGFDDDKPQTWRVSFRCFSSPVYGGSGSRRSRETMGAAQAQDIVAANAHRPLSHAAHDSSPACGGAKGPKFYSAWPLAERYEALLRVFADPAPYARRLAARLHALPHRLQELLRLPKRRRERQSGEPADSPDLVGRESFERVEAALREHWPAPNTS